MLVELEREPKRYNYDAPPTPATWVVFMLGVGLGVFSLFLISWDQKPAAAALLWAALIGTTFIMWKIGKDLEKKRKAILAKENEGLLPHLEQVEKTLGVEITPKVADFRRNLPYRSVWINIPGCQEIFDGELIIANNKTDLKVFLEGWGNTSVEEVRKCRSQ